MPISIAYGTWVCKVLRKKKVDKFYLFGHILGKIGFDGLEKKNLCQNPCKCTGHQNVFSTLEEPRFLST